MRDRRWALAGLVVAATLMTGCSEKQQANETLPSPSAAETSESLPQVGPADFPVPDEARTKDAAGAEAFLRYYVELSNRQQDRLDGHPLRKLGPDCQECLRIAQDFDEVAAARQKYEGGRITLNDVTPVQMEADKASITFGARQEPVRLIDAAGNTVDELPLQPNLGSGISLVWSEHDHTWLVESLNIG
ncbi:MAG: uncharacterized protein JWR45_2056 [Blastococcus sp.]|nr:uncharacterized protein [Blastococcus sp.]